MCRNNNVSVYDNSGSTTAQRRPLKLTRLRMRSNIVLSKKRGLVSLSVSGVKEN